MKNKECKNKTKAYAVGSKYGEKRVIVYAKTNKEAKIFAYNSCLIGDLDEYINIRANREYWADGLRTNGEVLNFCDNVELFHKNGWCCEDGCLVLDCQAKRIYE